MRTGEYFLKLFSVSELCGELLKHYTRVWSILAKFLSQIYTLFSRFKSYCDPEKEA